MKKRDVNTNQAKMKLSNALAVFLIIVLFSTSCKPEPTDDDKADTEIPTIEILLPLEGAVFSTNLGLTEASEAIAVSAIISDNELITRVDVSLKKAVTEVLTYFEFTLVNNPRGESYNFSDELTEYTGKPNLKIGAGEYFLTFSAIDNNDNITRVTRTITYVDPVTDVETDGETDN
jgi:hypothetical protein